MSAKTGTIPIIVLTASEDPQVEAQAVAAGAIGFFRKPWDNTAVLEAIKRTIGGGER